MERSKNTAEQKIALVTGGSRGMGRSMALNLAAKGLNVILTYNSNQESAQGVVAEIEHIGKRAIALQLDTTQVVSFDNFFVQIQQTLQTEFGVEKFDYLINNAGIGITKPFAETTEADFDALVNIHFKGVYFLTQKALPLLNDNGGIVNISSGLTRTPVPGVSAYAGAKNAIEALTRSLAKELGSRGINVNAIAPGAIATDFGGGALKTSVQMQEYMKSITAIPRVGQPEDVGPVVAFLCTDEAKWINAQRIEVSGGMNI